jgi:serine phosphatase RsbU (regulator of sigma subunit)/anti-sigma regulatory factor (Ser/Thr protein kinase)
MPSLPQHADRIFPAEARSVAAARDFARDKLREWDATDMADSAALLISELLTNAVVHTGTEARVDLRLDSTALRIEVEDRHPSRTIALQGPLPHDDSESGRGLLITSALASSWGVEYTTGAKRVWVRCEREVVPVPRGHPFAGPGSGDEAHPHVAAVGISPSGLVTGWNADATELFGWADHEVLGRPFQELVDPVPGERPPTTLASLTQGFWQGAYRLVCRDGSSAEVFGSHVVTADGRGAAALLVPLALRRLVEHPAAPQPSRAESDPIGLRDDALVRLGLDDFLKLAVERVRDAVTADVSYLLMFRDFDDVFEVVAVSGLPDGVRGRRLEAGTPGAPDARTPRLPLVIQDLSVASVPLLGGTPMQSLSVVPVVVEGRVVGALGAASESAHGFTDHQSAVLQRCADAIALATDRARLQASERERRGWLSFVAEAGDLLAASLDQAKTMAITGQIVVPRLATWSAVYLVDERGASVLHHVWHADEQRVDELRQSLENAEPPATTDSSDLVGGDSVTSIPLVARARRVGLLVLGRPKGDPVRNELVLVAESVARRVALAIDNAITHGELHAVGEALQRSLLPHSMPSAPGLEVGVVYEAAGERTAAGGDFYDFFPLSGGRWCFAVGDVCGTGAQAAAVTGLARHTIRALTQAGFPVAATLERLNTAILDEGDRARFLTLVCGILQVDGRRVRLSMVNAGHPLPFLVCRDETVRQISSPQSLLGVIGNEAYVDEEHVLEPGDLLVLLTDGVLERRAGERMLGDEGVIEELTTAGGLPAEAVAQSIRRLVMDFAPEPPHDDMAIMAIRVDAAVHQPE